MLTLDPPPPPCAEPHARPLTALPHLDPPAAVTMWPGCAAAHDFLIGNPRPDLTLDRRTLRMLERE